MPSEAARGPGLIRQVEERDWLSPFTAVRTTAFGLRCRTQDVSIWGAFVAIRRGKHVSVRWRSAGASVSAALHPRFAVV